STPPSSPSPTRSRASVSTPGARCLRISKPRSPPSARGAWRNDQGHPRDSRNTRGLEWTAQGLEGRARELEGAAAVLEEPRLLEAAGVLEGAEPPRLEEGSDQPSRPSVFEDGS